MLNFIQQQKMRKGVSPLNNFKNGFFISLLIIAAVIILIFLSEGIYNSNNYSPQLVNFYANQASNAAQNSDVSKTLKNLKKVSDIKVKKQVAKKNPGISLDTKIVIPPFPNNPNFKEDYVNFLKGIDYKALPESDPSELAKEFYTLGLLAYKNKEPDLVTPFWKTAVNLAPEWSYFHVELANFYLSSGQKDKAQTQIEFCLQFFSPKDHCQRFMEQSIQTDTPQSMGSWKEEIDKI